MDKIPSPKNTEIRDKSRSSSKSPERRRGENSRDIYEVRRENKIFASNMSNRNQDIEVYESIYFNQMNQSNRSFGSKYRIDHSSSDPEPLGCSSEDHPQISHDQTLNETVQGEDYVMFSHPSSPKNDIMRSASSSPNEFPRREHPSSPEDYVMVSAPSSSKDSVENNPEIQRWERFGEGYRPQHRRSVFSSFHSVFSPEHRHIRGMVKKADIDLKAEKQFEEMNDKTVECVKRAREEANKIYNPLIKGLKNDIKKISDKRETEQYKDLENTLKEINLEKSKMQEFLRDKFYNNATVTAQFCEQQKTKIDELYGSRIAHLFKQLTLPTYIPFYLNLSKK